VTVALLYTDTDQVRSALGFDPSDAKDGLLSSAKLELALEYDLDDWLSNHDDIWTDSQAGGATAEEIKKGNVLCLYSQWCIAYMVAKKKPLYLQIVSDGKAQLNRFDFDLDDVVAMCSGEKKKWKDLLLTLEGREDEITNTVPDLVAISPPDFDPVTGA